jgi:hypothetical protein
MDQDKMSNSHRGPSIDASYHVPVHLPKLFQRRRFLEINQSEKKFSLGKWTGTWQEASMEGPLWELLILSRSINKHGHHRPFLFLIGRFLKIFSSEDALLWRPCLLMDWDKMSNRYRGPSIDASYQVSVHLAKRLQRRRYLEIDQSETRIASSVGIAHFVPIH